MKKRREQKSSSSHFIEAAIVFGISLLICLILFGAFGLSGQAVSGFFIGTFGYVSYGLALGGVILSLLIVFKFRIRRDWHIVLFTVLSLLSLVLLFQTVTSSEIFKASDTYGSYLTGCYGAEDGTMGGLLAGLITYPLMAVNEVFAIVLFALLFTAMLGLLFFSFYRNIRNTRAVVLKDNGIVRYKKNRKVRPVDFNREALNDDIDDIGADMFTELVDGRQTKDKLGKSVLKREIHYEPLSESPDLNPELRGTEEAVIKAQSNIQTDLPQKKSSLDKLFDDDYLKKQGYMSGESQSKSSVVPLDEGMRRDPDQIENPRERAINILYNNTVNDIRPDKSPKLQIDKSQYTSYTNNSRLNQIRENLHKKKNLHEDEDINGTAPSDYDTADIYESITRAISENTAEETHEEIINGIKDIFAEDADGVDDTTEDKTEHNEGPFSGFSERRPRSDKGGTHNSARYTENSYERPEAKTGDAKLPKFIARINETKSETVKPAPEPVIPAQKIETPAEKPKPRKKVPYIAPPIDILNDYPSRYNGGSEDFTEKAARIENTLASFDINATVISHKRGSTFTRFELQMPPGVSVRKIVGLADDLAMYLEVESIRIQAPIPGKNAVGIEVPNEIKDTVGVKSIVCSPEFNKNKKGLQFALGQDIDGISYVGDIAKMVHTVVAGSTGSGKSVGINALLCSMLYKYTPDEVKFIMIDPKMVELESYRGLPHLLIPDIITEPPQVLKAMDWAIKIMQERQITFTNLKLKNIDDYNDWAVKNGEEKMNYLVLIIDEIADLIETIKKPFEEKLSKLVKLARFSGIHLVVATQRPSVDVLTGTIKNNLPSRIAYQVQSGNDSKTIINTYGAEKLLGNGDMLFSPGYHRDPIRLQGAFISGEEVNAICDFVREKNEAYFDDTVRDAIMVEKQPEMLSGPSNGGGEDGERLDDLFVDALRVVIQSNSASIAKLQRKLTIGYPRAARIIDAMENMGYISGENGAKSREVYITREEFEDKYGEYLDE